MEGAHRGKFSSFNGTNHRPLAAERNGNLDSGFDRARADGGISALALQPDGACSSAAPSPSNGVLRPYVARLYGDSAANIAVKCVCDRLVVRDWPELST
jgi:hypothetical protein